MKKIILATLLSAFSFAASAQSHYHSRVVSEARFPVYETVYERGTHVCEDVIVGSSYNPGGAVIGGVIGYAIGRELDRGDRHGGYVGGMGYVPHRGGYYHDHRGYYHGGHDSRVGRYGGTVAGVVIGSQVGRPSVQQVCREVRSGYSRQELVGHRVVIRHADGSQRERFEPVR